MAGALGAEITGVDLAENLDQETHAQIQKAFLDHQVLIFRDQRALTVEGQIAFARRFGPLVVDPIVKGTESHPELLVVIKDKEEKRAFGENWHQDCTFMEKPPLAAFLHARELPPFGGDTQFSNQYMAYETLSPGLKQMLGQLRAVHGAESYSKGIQAGRFGTDRKIQLRYDETMRSSLETEVVHPVVRTHPDTGRKALFVNASFTKRFEGWTESESEPLLQFLYRHSARPEFTCRMQWSPDALLVWDNRCTMHQAINDYDGYRRVMNRVTAEGDRPL
jgi:taurine dioxygenase